VNDSHQTMSLFPTSSWEEAPVRTSQWLENVLAWVESEVDCSTNNAELLTSSEPNGWCGKMSLALSPATQAKTSQPCSEASPETLQLFPSVDGATQAFASAPIESQSGGCLTLKTSESHSAAVACSLSQVLEPWRDELLKFCLSQKAATGILRRAENRGRTLPPRLVNALEQLAGGGLSEISQCITARTGCRGDLETESFILETAEPLQPVVGTLAPGAHGSGASTVNGQDAYSGQLVPVRVWAGSAQRDDQAAPLLHGGDGIRTTDIDGASWVIEQVGDA